jgi:hypothetical protein
VTEPAKRCTSFIPRASTVGGHGRSGSWPAKPELTTCPGAAPAAAAAPAGCWTSRTAPASRRCTTRCGPARCRPCRRCWPAEPGRTSATAGQCAPEHACVLACNACMPYFCSAGPLWLAGLNVCWQQPSSTTLEHHAICSQMASTPSPECTPPLAPQRHGGLGQLRHSRVHAPAPHCCPWGHGRGTRSADRARELARGAGSVAAKCGCLLQPGRTAIMSRRCILGSSSV